MRTPQTTPVTTKSNAAPRVTPESNVCLTSAAFYDAVQEDGEMDDLRGRIERCGSFRDAFNDLD